MEILLRVLIGNCFLKLFVCVCYSQYALQMYVFILKYEKIVPKKALNLIFDAERAGYFVENEAVAFEEGT